MKNQKTNNKPEILGAFDLAHLNRGQRIPLIGADHWMSRREFLKKLLGLGAIITLPAFFSISCGGSDTGGGSSSGGETGDIIVDAPMVISTYPDDGDVTTAISFISISFSKPMNQTSVNQGMGVDPAIPGYDFAASGPWWSADSKIAEYQVGVDIPEGTIYTFSLDGSAKSQDGYFLNQTDAGGGGTSYFFKVYYGITGCAADCGCESYVACSCQYDGGVGCEYYGGICWCEVQCGCQLYGIQLRAVFKFPFK